MPFGSARLLQAFLSPVELGRSLFRRTMATSTPPKTDSNTSADSVDAQSEPPKDSSGPGGTPFWNVNITPAHHTAECPEYLKYVYDEHGRPHGLHKRNIVNMATLDSEFQPHTWVELQKIVRENRLEDFRRLPSDTRLYREVSAGLKKDHGDIVNFVISERLKWKSTKKSGAPPFENPDDYKIIFNDWPYGGPPGMTHLVVWTKFGLPTDGTEKGDITPETREMIQRFVDPTFVEKCGNDNILWFKNWGRLMSVHGDISHLHVLLNNAPSDFVKEIAHGDIALAESVRAEKVQQGLYYPRPQ